MFNSIKEKNMKRKSISILMGVVFLFSVSSCDLFDLDINTDPNNPATVSPALLLNNVEVDGFAAIVGNFNTTGMGFTVQTDASDNFFFNNQSWNGAWNGLYTGPLKDLDELIKLVEVDVAPADGNSDQPRYLGIAQVLKAYMFSVMVDWWGDIPYSEAFQGNATPQNKNPQYDDDEEIYADCLALLDKAIANLALPSPAISGDVIYAGNATRWTKAAKSLKLKLLLQTRFVGTDNNKAAIQALLTDQAGLITSAADDFLFQFSPSISPDYRHPNYAMGGAAYGGGYVAHQLMFEMLRNKDPRLPFYIKRQTKTVLDPNDATQKQTIPCSQRTDCVFGYFPLSNFVAQAIYSRPAEDLATPADVFSSDFGAATSADKATITRWYVRNGEVAIGDRKIADLSFGGVTTEVFAPYTGLLTQVKAEGGTVSENEVFGRINAPEYLAGLFGRDRADPSGIPDDAGVRTAHGLYPYGGLYDDIPEPANQNKGRGDGIFPIATSWMVKFWEIEAILALNLSVPGETAATLLEKAMREQIAKVNSFATKDAGSIPMTAADINTYVTKWLSDFNAAPANQKLGVALKQAWFCNYGNGLELYNTFRRTGLPGDLQNPLQLPGNFALSIPYAQDELNLNGANVPAKVYDNPVSGYVFWDDLRFQFN